MKRTILLMAFAIVLICQSAKAQHYIYRPMYPIIQNRPVLVHPYVTANQFVVTYRVPRTIQYHRPYAYGHYSTYRYYRSIDDRSMSHRFMSRNYSVNIGRRIEHFNYRPQTKKKHYYGSRRKR